MKKHWHLFAKIKKTWVALPYVWLSLFFVIPFIYLAKISFAESILSVPPISHLVEFSAPGKISIALNFSNYIRLFTESFYLSGFFTSLIFAGLTTFFCLVIGYAMAYSLIQLPQDKRTLGLLLIMIPFVTSFLIRVYAWITLLSQEGIINTWLIKFGFISSPLPLLYNDFSVLVGLVYCYLPFMILPIYSVLEKLEPVLLEAGADLGATPFRRFIHIVLPLSKPGILAGCILVFVPVTGEFVIPEILGGPDNLMIGRILWMEFFNNRDWPLAAGLAVMLLMLFVIPIMLLQKYQGAKES